MSKLERTAFEFSRAREYFELRELATLTGQEPENFATVVLKELVDNALDGCEMAGVAPHITVEVDGDVTPDDGEIRMSVTDNGGGIPPEVVTKVLDYNIRVSDKSAYRSPTRGAQGNALKAVVGIPHALGGREPIVIEGRGVRHEIRPWIDPAGAVRIEHEESPSSLTDGTRVSVALPVDEQFFDPLHWVRSFALFNPHASLIYHGECEGEKVSDSYKSTGDQFKKYMPSEPTSPHWYTPGNLATLIFAYVGEARNGGRDVPLGEFLRLFKGLTSTKKAKEVASAFAHIKYLSDLEDHQQDIPFLLKSMQDATKAPRHEAIGLVGPEHFENVFRRLYEVEEFNYTKVKSYLPSGLPYTFEAALAVTSSPGHLYCGINFSPAFGDPLEGTLLAGPEFKAHGIRGFLSRGRVLPQSYVWSESPTNTAMAVHIVTPAPIYLDKGKTRIQMETRRAEEEVA
jgi:DNA topoisomerase VI subunit B